MTIQNQSFSAVVDSDDPQPAENDLFDRKNIVEILNSASFLQLNGFEPPLFNYLKSRFKYIALERQLLPIYSQIYYQI